VSGADNCGDSRVEVVHWADDSSVWLNEENVGLARAPARVAQIMQNRAERIVFLIPGENTTVQDVTGLAARLQNSTDDLHIALVTNRQLAKMTRTDHGMTWVPVDCLGVPSSAIPSLSK
jgi:biopolymer transport protein ExbD